MKKCKCQCCNEVVAEKPRCEPVRIVTGDLVYVDPSITRDGLWRVGRIIGNKYEVKMNFEAPTREKIRLVGHEERFA